MIAKMPHRRRDGGSSFYALAKYIVNGDDGEIRAVHANTRNTFYEFDENDKWAWQTVAAEMDALGDTNARCANKGALHFILSFREHETPSREQVDEAVEIALKELGLDKCKALYGLQADNGIPHVHVAVCRIDPETGKAIHPAGGWTKKALNKASRKIELAQNWEIERSDTFWDVTGDGKIVKKDRVRGRDEAPKLDENARDLEIHTGEKSAQTVVIETASPIIKNARSWGELHEKLNEAGFRFERKGSGAVIVVGNEIVKASSIGQNYSLSKLEKRFGEFVNREGASTAGNITVPQPTRQTQTTEKTLSAWQRHQLYKKEHGELKELKNSLFGEHKKQREKLCEQHKRERDTLFRSRQTWKGYGKELNYERMVLASQQFKERLLLQEEQKAEREKLPDVPKFLSYRKWLAENQPELITDLRCWRENERRENDLSQVSVLQIYNPDMEEKEALRMKMFTTLNFADQDKHEKSESLLKNFAAFQVWKHSDKKTLSYSLKGEKTAFVESKNEITVFQNTESALLAAMQLAQNKWGIIKLDGTRKNLDTCMKLAKEYNIKIQVPEKYLETLKNEKREQIPEHESYLEEFRYAHKISKLTTLDANVHKLRKNPLAI